MRFSENESCIEKFAHPQPRMFSKNYPDRQVPTISSISRAREGIVNSGGSKKHKIVFKSAAYTKELNSRENYFLYN